MAKAIGEVIIDIERCKGCDLCVDACPTETLVLSNRINQKGYHYAIRIDRECNGCAVCAIICPEAIITVYRKVVKKEKVVA